MLSQVEEEKKKQEANVLNKAPATPVSGLELAAPLPNKPPVAGPPPGVTTQSPPFATPTGLPGEDEEALQNKYNHQSFYESLQSLSNEDPRILAAYISKYAKSIQKNDLATAVKLFNIVKRIK